MTFKVFLIAFWSVVVVALAIRVLYLIVLIMRDVRDNAPLDEFYFFEDDDDDPE